MRELYCYNFTAAMAGFTEFLELSTKQKENTIKCSQALWKDIPSMLQGSGARIRFRTHYLASRLALQWRIEDNKWNALTLHCAALTRDAFQYQMVSRICAIAAQFARLKPWLLLAVPH